MPRKRANGEGNIRKRKDGRWEGRYTAGHDPATGKQVFKSVLGKTQTEVKAKLRKAIDDSKNLDFSKSGKYTVGQWMDVWFENYAKLKVRPSSHQTYQGYINNHIKPNIGDIPIEKLTSLELQKFYKKLLTEGRVPRIESERQPKGLSAKTVRNINQVISSAMDMAVEQKIILTNPTNGCALPKVEHKEMHTIPAEQLNAFLREAKNSGVYELYYLDLATGLRRGELLGLKWSDIDLKTGIIHVKRQVARVNGEIKEVPLKTKNSYRNIAISKDAVEMLSEMKSRNLSEYVFPSATGGPISPDSVNNMLHRVLKRAGLPSIRFHDMRHTFATLALQNGVDIKTVSSMLGHFSAGFTLDTYAHVTTGAQREAANTMGNVLSVV
jgi:integrase